MNHNPVPEMFEKLIDFAMFMFFFGVFFWGMVWALERERQLGIDGMSSERILVREEMKK